MLSRIANAENLTVSFHRTYLTRNGSKAPVEKPKKLMKGISKLKGAAIRLNDIPKSRVLGVCEGIETGLAVLTAYKNSINVWALISCTNLSVADIPKDRFDKVIIFADHDKIDPGKGYRPGEHFARILENRLISSGFEVVFKQPPHEETDFADVWKDYQQMRSSNYGK